MQEDDSPREFSSVVTQALGMCFFNNKEITV
jgi:hypothetical protein